MRAYDENDKEIAAVTKNYGMWGNTDKIRDFQKAIRDQGYQLTAAQFADLCEKMTVGPEDILSLAKENAPFIKGLVIPNLLKAASGQFSTAELLGLLTQGAAVLGREEGNK